MARCLAGQGMTSPAPHPLRGTDRAEDIGPFGALVWRGKASPRARVHVWPRDEACPELSKILLADRLRPLHLATEQLYLDADSGASPGLTLAPVPGDERGSTVSTRKPRRPARFARSGAHGRASRRLAKPSAYQLAPDAWSRRARVANVSKSHRARSLRRQRTTPSTAGTGPASTTSASARR